MLLLVDNLGQLNVYLQVYYLDTQTHSILLFGNSSVPSGESLSIALGVIVVD